MILADSSAWILAVRDRTIGAQLRPLVYAGQIATVHPVRLEILRGTASPRALDKARAALDAVADVAITQSVWQRALDVQRALARRRGGLHRGATPIDLIVAAAAELSGMVLLHRDRDFELIASVTGQGLRTL